MKVSWVIVALRLPSPLLSKTRGRGLTVNVEHDSVPRMGHLAHLALRPRRGFSTRSRPHEHNGSAFIPPVARRCIGGRWIDFDCI